MSDIDLPTNLNQNEKKKVDKKVSIISSKEHSTIKLKEGEIENKPKFYSRDSKFNFKPSFYTKLIMSGIEAHKKKSCKKKENVSVPNVNLSLNKIKREIKSLDSLALKSFELKSCKSIISKKPEVQDKNECKDNNHNFDNKSINTNN